MSEDKVKQFEQLVAKYRLYNMEPEKRYGGDGPVDENIVEAVAALNALGITTTASCGGHIDKSLGAPMLQGILEDAEKDSMQRAKVVELMNEFNSGRDEDYKLILNNITSLGFRIENAISDKVDKDAEVLFCAMSEEDQKLTLGYVEHYEPEGRARVEKIVIHCQKEFADFTQFLKEKYFSS